MRIFPRMRLELDTGRFAGEVRLYFRLPPIVCSERASGGDILQEHVAYHRVQFEHTALKVANGHTFRCKRVDVQLIARHVLHAHVARR